MFAYIIRSICEPDVGMDGTKNRRGRIRLLAPPTMLLSKDESEGAIDGRVVGVFASELMWRRHEHFEIPSTSRTTHTTHLPRAIRTIML